MKLADWLKSNGVKRKDFAARIGVSPSHVTALCEYNAAWPGKTVARNIMRETRGAVTANDFLGPLRGDHKNGAAA